jgi:RimJ/RimL family protein N-acetyltransferase
MPKPQPVLRTRRLLLRSFAAEDAERVRELAGAREIADTTISIPHPYPRGAAERWIEVLPQLFEAGVGAHFAVTSAENGELLGSVALRDVDREHSQAELGFWVGVPWWGRGYATEAAREVIRFGFETLALNRIYAHHMLRNPASGKVLRKLGMTQEGLLRQRVRKWGRFEDVAVYAVLHQDLVSARD